MNRDDARSRLEAGGEKNAVAIREAFCKLARKGAVLVIGMSVGRTAAAGANGVKESVLRTATQMLDGVGLFPA